MQSTAERQILSMKGHKERREKQKKEMQSEKKGEEYNDERAREKI